MVLASRNLPLIRGSPAGTRQRTLPPGPDSPTSARRHTLQRGKPRQRNPEMAPDPPSQAESTYPIKVDTLKVPGATLYHELRGSGPVLLMIPGGPADASVFTPIASLLADRYAVVTYDTRGNSRSRLDGPPEDQRMEVHSDDAHRLLAALGTEPAYVLGS